MGERTLLASKEEALFCSPKIFLDNSFTAKGWGWGTVVLIHVDKPMRVGVQGATGLWVGSWFETATVNFHLKNDILHTLSVGFLTHTDLLTTICFFFPLSLFLHGYT